jgi:hypothetical protein
MYLKPPHRVAFCVYGEVLMLTPHPSLTDTLSHKGRWLIMFLLIVALVLLFARKITQLALPGLGIQPKTITIEPKCPTPEQKEVIEKNLRLYGAGFVQGYDPTPYGQNLLAMARTLGYPKPSLDEINAVLRYLREALKKKC